MFHGTHPVTIKLKFLYPTWISILNLQLDTQLWFIRANIGNIPLNKMFVLTRAYIFLRIPTTWSCKSLIVLYVTKVACFSHSFCFYCTTEIFFFFGLILDFGLILTLTCISIFVIKFLLSLESFWRPSK